MALTLRTLVRALHRGDRAGLPGPAPDHGAAPRPRQGQDPRRPHPVPRPASEPTARAARCRAGGRLPGLQRGLRGELGERLVRAELCARRSASGACSWSCCRREPEAQGLLALMLLHDARRDSARGRERRPRALEEQDRSRWDRGADRRGHRARGGGAARAGRPAPTRVQAAIAAVHAEAQRRRPRRIGARSRRSTACSLRLQPSPVIELNHAVAVAMADGPEQGLRILDRLEAGEELAAYHLFRVARAELLRGWSGRAEAARSLSARARPGRQRVGAAAHSQAAGGARAPLLTGSSGPGGGRAGVPAAAIQHLAHLAQQGVDREGLAEERRARLDRRRARRAACPYSPTSAARAAPGWAFRSWIAVSGPLWPGRTTSVISRWIDRRGLGGDGQRPARGSAASSTV